MVRSGKSLELVISVVVIFVQHVLLTRKQGDLEKLETQWPRFWRLGRPTSGSGNLKGPVIQCGGKTKLTFYSGSNFPGEWSHLA